MTPTQQTGAPGGGRGAIAARLELGLVVVLAMILLALVARSHAGLFPVILDDEYVYSTDSRLKPLADAIRPIYLYLALYRATNLCGADFLECARSLNLVFLAGTGFLVALCARRVVSRRMAAWIGLLTIAGPLNVYTAYFMPEAMYACGFWAVVWIALGADGNSGWRRWALVGSAIGLLTLVKPHALFLIPAFTIHAAAVVAKRGVRPTWRNGRILLVAAAALLVKFVVGYAIAGTAALTLFGSSYGGMAGTMAARADRTRIAIDFATSLAGHAMALVLLFAMPLAVLARIVFARAAPGEDSARWRLCVLTASVLVVLTTMACAFTASVAGTGPYEVATRLHLRYYDFALPLLVIVGTLAWTKGPSAIALRAFVVVLALVTAYAAVRGFDPFTPAMIDGPWLYGAASRVAIRRVYGAAMLAALALLFVRPRLVAPLFAVLILPWLFYRTALKDDENLTTRRVPDRFDAAGVAAKRALTPDQLAHLRVVVDDPAGPSRVMFQLDDARVTGVSLPSGARVTAAQWPRSAEWLLVVGDLEIAEPGIRRQDFGTFVLARRSAADAAARDVR